MATPSGAPPTQTPAAATTTSPDKKKLFIALGVAGIAVLGIGGFFVMRSLNGDATTVADTSATNTAIASNSATPETVGEPGSTLPNGGIPPAGATQISTGTANNPSTLLPLSPYRRDPFQPFVILPPPPTPAPPPPPTPTPPPRPVPIPQPEAFDVPRPGGGVFGGGGAPAPGFAVPGPNGSGASEGPLILPTVVIPRLNSTKLAPTNAFPPPRSSSGAGSAVASPSFDKRLSGVVIGNGVRAILEINSGGAEPKTYVVQPGDVVEGITILNIRRYNESGTQVTRMLIRENGGERTVDLKPGPPRTALGGELGSPEGIGGFGGAPGGFGGDPRSFGGVPRGFGGG